MRPRVPLSRFVTLATVMALVLVALLGRLFWIQVITAEKWQREVVRQSSQQVRVPARRGSIYDRNGTPLALTEERVKVGVTDPAHWRDHRDRLKRLASLLDISPQHLRQRLRGSGHVVVHQAAVLSPQGLEDLRREPTVTLHRFYHRTYPTGNLATRLLGRVGSNGQGDAGLELHLNQTLAGRDGREIVLRDGLRHQTLRRLPLTPATLGGDVTLTLDIRMQMILEEELSRAVARSGASEGCAILMDPRTGDVLALAEAPLLTDRDRRTYPVDQWRTRSATDLFEPGSTFKLFTFASLFSQAVVDTSEIFDGEKQPGHRKASADLGDLVLHDDHPVGPVSLRHAFLVSSNIITGKVVSYLRDDEFHGDLRRFGFGYRTGSGWPAESVGILRKPAAWSKRSKPTIAIGQEVGVSLFQLAAGYCALIGDGTLRSPRFLMSWRDSRGRQHEPVSNVTRKRLVSPSVIPLLRELCRGVVREDYGTGTAAAVDGIAVGGKTGTGQIPGQGGYRRDAFTASFVGFAPVDEPRILGAIVLHGARGAQRWGGQAAAPAFGEVIRNVLISTHWLDDAAQPDLPQATPETSELPDLRGWTAERLTALIRQRGWTAVPSPPTAGARVLGHVPLPGATLTPGARLQVAWARGATP